MRRVAWDVLLALLVGFGAGLLYAWMISPLRVTTASPAALRADFQDRYRAAIAAAYHATGNLPRAEARLALLQDADPAESLNAQAQRMLANDDSAQQADQVAALALALEEGSNATSPTATEPTTEIVDAIAASPTITLPPPPPDVPIQLTGTLGPAETATAALTPTPRPTRTSVPTLAAPFKLTAEENVCDPNLPEGLLQIVVLNANRRQMPGVKIMITWQGGEEQFFTGLKPELGNGYADYLMTPDNTYTVQLAIGSDVAAGISPPTCQSPTGESFSGGIKLTFQQP